jgi:glutamyl-Q tRNA(Asp) synthetase
MSQAQIRACMEEGRPFAWRLRMNAAIAAVRDLSWAEDGAGPNGETGCVKRSPAEWGDVVIARRDVPTSYHLAVVVDDAIQEISHVVRGRDLFAATSVHRLLQELLGLPAPRYFHHDLILGDDDRKLSKSRGDTALASLREAGLTPQDIRRMVGLEKI